MKQLINIREANQHLSRYIDAVQDGDEIIITRRGLPVARLSAFAKSLELNDAQKAARRRSRVRMRKDILWEEKCLRGRHCMKERRLTLDTNILFYAMDRDAEERHKLAMEIVDRASAFDC